MEFDGISELDDMLTKIRDFPEGMSAEDTMRQLLGEQEMFSAKVQSQLSNAESVKNSMLQETSEAKDPRSKGEHSSEAYVAEAELALWKLGEAVMHCKWVR